MQIAILLYDRFTALDAIGPYEVLSRLDHAEVVFAAERPGPVHTDTGMLAITADASIGELAHPDIVLVPGGPAAESPGQGIRDCVPPTTQRLGASGRRGGLKEIPAGPTRKARPRGAGLPSRLFRRRPTLPGGYPPSTIGADRLNFRVRDGYGCDSVALATGNLAHIPSCDCRSKPRQPTAPVSVP